MLFAGTDTTSNALGHTLQMLAQHPDVQSQLRGELATARDFNGQDISYDRLVELPLLDAVCRETLRLCADPFRCYTSTDDYEHSHSPVNVVPRE